MKINVVYWREKGKNTGLRLKSAVDNEESVNNAINKISKDKEVTEIRLQVLR